jgi:hypothetical protein
VYFYEIPHTPTTGLFVQITGSKSVLSEEYSVVIHKIRPSISFIIPVFNSVRLLCRPLTLNKKRILLQAGNQDAPDDKNIITNFLMDSCFICKTTIARGEHDG